MKAWHGRHTDLVIAEFVRDIATPWQQEESTASGAYCPLRRWENLVPDADERLLTEMPRTGSADGTSGMTITTALSMLGRSIVVATGEPEPDAQRARPTQLNGFGLESGSRNNFNSESGSGGTGFVPVAPQKHFGQRDERMDPQSVHRTR